MAILLQRPLRGSRISSFYPVKSLPSLSSLDSAFQLQEYISLLIRLNVHDVDAIVSIPGRSSGKEKEIDGGETTEEGKPGDKDAEKKAEVAVDEACWIYEQLRRLAQDLSHPLITMLQLECTRSSCPEMKAGEWLYLCVAHGNEGALEQCCAIDYVLHTLDSATALLNSPRAFPSRLQIPQTSHRHFSSLARRLGRIFAHAYFHHREAFEQAEAESSLYARFLALTSKFNLVPPEFLVIPPRQPQSESSDRRDVDVQPPRLLAAAIDPQGDRDRDRAREQASNVPEWNQGSSSTSEADKPPKSASPPGLGTDSPRKMGRNRTDTMVFSEAFNIVEDLKFGEDGAARSSPRVFPASGKINILDTTDLGSRQAQPETSSPEEEAGASPAAVDAIPDPIPTEDLPVPAPIQDSEPLSSEAPATSLEEIPPVELVPTGPEPVEAGDPPAEPTLSPGSVAVITSSAPTVPHPAEPIELEGEAQNELTDPEPTSAGVTEPESDALEALSDDSTSAATNEDDGSSEPQSPDLVAPEVSHAPALESRPSAEADSVVVESPAVSEDPSNSGEGLFSKTDDAPSDINHKPHTPSDGPKEAADVPTLPTVSTPDPGIVGPDDTTADATAPEDVTISVEIASVTAVEEETPEGMPEPSPVPQEGDVSAVEAPSAEVEVEKS